MIGAPPFGSQRSDPPPYEGVLQIMNPWQRFNSLPICPCLSKYIDIYDWRTPLWVPEIGPAAVGGCVADHESLAALGQHDALAVGHDLHTRRQVGVGAQKNLGRAKDNVPRWTVRGVRVAITIF